MKIRAIITLYRFQKVLVSKAICVINIVDDMSKVPTCRQFETRKVHWLIFIEFGITSRPQMLTPVLFSQMLKFL